MHHFIVITLLANLIANAALTSESLCQSKLIQIFNNFSSSLALTTLLDSGKTINNYGMYRQCIKSAQNIYILLSIRPSHNYYYNYDIGLCLPSDCDAQQMDHYKQFVAFSFSQILHYPINQSMVYFVEAEKENVQYHKFHTATYISIVAFALLLIISLIGTQFENRAKGIAKIIGCFSIRKNAAAILYSENKIDACLNTLNGIRVLSMGWVLLGHSLYMLEFTPVLNIDHGFKLLRKTPMSVVLSGTLSVDAFFCLSGLLACLSLSRLFEDKRKINIKVILMLIIKRIVRLYPMYIAIFIIAYNIVPVVGNGPIHFMSNWLTNNCGTHWYHNILFFNNLDNPQSMCFIWTWYLANDMQFFLICIFIIAIYSFNKRTGIWVVLALIFASHIATLLIVILYKFPVYSSDPTTSQKLYTKIYYKPWARIPTYLIGVIFGWLYLANKEQRFDFKIANSINGTWKNNKIIRYTLYVIGLAICSIIVFSFTYFVNNEASLWLCSLYNTYNRSLFTIGMMLIIYPCIVGRCKALAYILGSDIMNAMARVTYSVYQIHLIIYTIYFMSSKQGIEVSGLFIVLNAMDVYIISYLIGFFLTLIVESPVVQLEKLVMVKQNKLKNEEAIELKVISQID